MNLCSHTPTLDVTDPRGLPVRRVGFYRANAQSNPDPRITRQAFDLAGRRFASSDPRLDRPATSAVFSLSGQPLFTDNVDAGWRLTLLGEAGQALESHDSRGTLSTVEYDDLMRPVARAETLDGEPARVFEQFMYGDASAQWVAHNQCGRLLRRDDSAGSGWFSEYGLAGAVLQQERRFLAQALRVDWPEDPLQCDRLLETECFTSSEKVGAGGDVIEQTDALRNHRFLAYACSGELKGTALQSSAGEATQILVSDIHYNAVGLVESETAGNGVISQFFHDAQDGRLTRMLALLPDAEALQDLRYCYDPVGNVVSVEDAAQEVSFFRNQRVEPVSRYVYDSLYQLIEATGREVASTSHLPGLPDLQNLPMDPQRLINYTQRFEYDAGGNLLARHHSGAETWRMAVSSASNRSLPQRADGTLPDEGQITEAFDGNGNLKALQPGQAMTWDARNQLSEVTTVVRQDGLDDSELYRYDGDGRRVRKVRVSQARSRTLTAQVIYLPGLEIHRNQATGEERHVVTVQGGRNSVRLLHWESGKPDGIENDQLRYSLGDHLGSSTLELDKDANLISYEGYYPFGGTAWWAGRSAVEAKYKTVRYSGKERDATGLYYYGFRYYAPWLQRWVNPDPAGDVQGVNRYRFVANSPLTQREKEGRIYEGINDHGEQSVVNKGDVIHWRGIQEFEPSARARVVETLEEVKQMYSDALAYLTDAPHDAEPVMRSYFGPEHEVVQETVKAAFKATAAMASEYASSRGGDKMVGIEVAGGRDNAYIFKQDFHGRIFIDISSVFESNFKTTLAHELTHLRRVNRFATTVGAHAKDNFYLWGSEMSRLTGNAENRYDVKEEEVSNVIMNGGLTINYMEPHWGFNEFLRRVSFLNEGPDFQGVDQALQVFNTQPLVSAHMAAENADSLAFAAQSLQRQYRWRQQDAHVARLMAHW